MDPVIAAAYVAPASDPLSRLSNPALTPRERADLEDLVTATYLPIARRLASRFTRSGAELDDLVQVASLALVKAIRRFNAERGEFEKYAHATINGELKKHLRDQCWSVRPPRRVQELHAQIGKATEELAQSGRSMPSVTSLAAQLDARPDDIREAVASRTCFRAVSLDQPIDVTGRSMGEAISEEFRDFDSVDDAMELAELFGDLNEHERRMLWLRFVDGCTQREIAEIMGMSQMMVSRRLGVLLADLRARAGSAVA
ncbi:MAG: sigma-70 family RNA polymerase sigma factor [bacterium]|nr:sigma-70 family RNA polymerase sigma factor [bacterium]